MRQIVRAARLIDGPGARRVDLGDATRDSTAMERLSFVRRNGVVSKGEGAVR